MMNFKQWKVINETYGRFALGVKSPRSVGTVGSKLSELGLSPGDMADDISGDSDMDDLGMGGMNDLGDDSGMGGSDFGSNGKITINDLDPSLLALLGLGKLAKQMGQPSPFGDDGDFGDEGMPFGDNDGDEEPDGDEDMPFGDNDGDEEPDGDEGMPFGDNDGDEEPDDDNDDDDDDDDDDDNDDDDEIPFGSSKDSDDDGETDDIDGDDDNDGVPNKVDKDKKKCNSGGDMKVQYSKKFMGKGGMKGCCKNEDSAFLNSLTNMCRGNVHEKFENGMPATQKRRLEAKPGNIGFAPQNRLGQNW